MKRQRDGAKIGEAREDIGEVLCGVGVLPHFATRTLDTAHYQQEHALTKVTRGL